MKQYAASPTIQQLVADRASYFAGSWHEDFYSTIWNVDTARGVGLNIWGRIVDIGRNIVVPETEYFGFNTTDLSWSPFGEESFYAGPTATQTVTLADNAYRVLILAKALKNITATDCRSMNRVLAELFPGRGRAWVNDLGSMVIRFVFEFDLEPWERAVLTSGDVLPRPAGVGAKLAEIPAETFGFAESVDGQPFNQGAFLGVGAISDAS